MSNQESQYKARGLYDENLLSLELQREILKRIDAYSRLVKVLKLFADVHSNEDQREALHAAMKACDDLLEELGELP